MKLLAKHEVDALKAQERKLEIDEGAKLARSVDQLRELKSTEERNLQKFRTDALARVQKEIDEEIQKLSHLKGEVEQARLQKQELQKPLTAEWDALNHEKSLFYKEKDDFVQHSVALREKESSLIQREKELTVEESRIAAEKARTTKLLKEADDAKKTAQRKELEASQVLDTSLKVAQAREERLTIREESIASRERDIVNVETHLKRKEQLLETERIQIADMRRTLERALARLK